MYDGVLRLKVPDEVKIVGFADDIAVIIQARKIEEVQLYAYEAIRTIKMWLESVNLKMAEHKTEAVLISSKRTQENLKIQIGRTEIVSSESIKYLGVIIDNRLTFKRHIEYSCQKATNVVNCLSKMMPNIGGQRQSRRRLLSQVANSILLYGSPIWEGSLRCTSRKDMMSIFRRSCLRVCSGYRTISLEASCIVAGIIPLDLTAREFANLYKKKKINSETPYRTIRREERNITMENWQRRWDNCTVGRWTYRLIKNVSSWINRSFGEVNYHLTQFLTGHGGYRSYLHRFGHDNSPRCPTCPDQDESVEHVMFNCNRFEEERLRLEIDIGSNLSPDNIIDSMLFSKSNWDRIEEFITYVNLILRREEQLRKEQRDSTLAMTRI